MDWNGFINKNLASFVLYARQWLPNKQDAEDAVQEAFIRFWNSSVRNSENPLPYLYKAIRWTAIDMLRNRIRKKETVFQDLELNNTGFFSSTEIDEQSRIKIEKFISMLPPEQREVLTMKIWGNLTFKEIAEIQGVSQNTAASRYRYAINTLKILMKDYLNK